MQFIWTLTFLYLQGSYDLLLKRFESVEAPGDVVYTLQRGEERRLCGRGSRRRQRLLHRSLRRQNICRVFVIGRGDFLPNIRLTNTSTSRTRSFVVRVLVHRWLYMATNTRASLEMAGGSYIGSTSMVGRKYYRKYDFCKCEFLNVNIRPAKIKTTNKNNIKEQYINNYGIKVI